MTASVTNLRAARPRLTPVSGVLPVIAPALDAENVRRETFCCGCGAVHSRAGQRYCHACHAAAQKRHRERLNEQLARRVDFIALAEHKLDDLQVAITEMRSLIASLKGGAA